MLNFPSNIPSFVSSVLFWKNWNSKLLERGKLLFTKYLGISFCNIYNSWRATYISGGGRRPMGQEEVRGQLKRQTFPLWDMKLVQRMGAESEGKNGAWWSGENLGLYKEKPLSYLICSSWHNTWEFVILLWQMWTEDFWRQSSLPREVWLRKEHGSQRQAVSIGRTPPKGTAWWPGLPQM